MGWLVNALNDRTVSHRKQVVSFDYDGTTVFPDENPDTGEFVSDDDGELVSTLNEAAADLMRMHARRGDKVVIVTARNPEQLGSVWDMIHKHSLPVSEVYATSHQSKVPILRSIGASIHYDDSPHHVEDINRMLDGKTKAYDPGWMELHFRDKPASGNGGNKS